MRRVSRRDFLATGSVALGTLPLIRATAFAQTADAVFRHGVASGDPLADRVILWTRVTPAAATGEVTVSWQVARDPKFGQVVSRGEARTGAARDFTVKVDVPRLAAGTTYYYRFESLGARSAIGRTRTLPREGVSRLRLGVVSCSNLPQGYFNAYACLARRADLDAILHLGDYIYEYPNKGYGDGTALGRIPSPDKEMVAPQTPAGTRAGNTDSWDGYRGARNRLFDMVERTRAANLAVLTGDVHSSWAYDLPRDPFAAYDSNTGKGSLGVEFAGTSVSSPSNVGGGPDGEKQLADLRAARPHLHYVDGRYRGYFVVDLTRERLQADFYAVATVLDRTTKERFERGFVTESGRNHLTAAATAAPAVLAPDPAP